MLGSILSRPAVGIVIDNRRRARLIWFIWFMGILSLTGLLGLIMVQFGPSPAQIAWILYIAGAIIIIRQPRHGIYLILFLVLVGDGILTPTYPFAKNFSSAESLFYLHDAIIVSPLEGYLLLILFTWLSRGVIERKLNFYKGPLFWQTLLLAFFLVLGLGYGILSRGNINVALWEARAIFYLPLMIILTSNLLQECKHFNHIFFATMTAIFIEGVIGVFHIVTVLGEHWREVDALTEHSAAIHMNTFFVLIMAAWLMKASYSKRLILPLLIPPILMTYLVSQRRAAFVTLALAMLLLLLALYFEKRYLFWLIVPPLAISGVLYIAIYWNASGLIGSPVQAVKTILAPNHVSAADQSSNFYRYLENLNISFTIHNSPLIGVGFGHKYHIIAPLPDISVFEWWEYITHNSVLWIWMKMGVGGFFAFLYLIGTAVMLGARSIWQVPAGDMRTVALVATLYVIMHFTFAYVDISWDGQSMLYVGAMIGLINILAQGVEGRVRT